MDKHPFVSVIMPVRNEADFIEQAVTSILNSEYPADQMEVLIVDGMSDDGTRQIISRLAEQDKRIHLLDNPKKIVPSAMNIGLRESRGSVFIRLDGHTKVPADFISNSVACLLEHSDAWVVGGSIHTVSETYTGKAISAAMRSPIGVGNSRFRLGDYEGWVDTVAFGAHHKWVLDKAGAFDEELVRNQDDEFNLRIVLAGGRIWMSKSIVCTYYARSSLRKLWRQYFQYGFWRIRTMQKHGRPATFRQVIPLLFVLSVAALAFAGLWMDVFWIVLVFEMIIYGLGLTIGAVDVGRNSGWQYAPIAPLIFGILHFGYGLGSLWGILWFSLLKRWTRGELRDMSLSR